GRAAVLRALRHGLPVDLGPARDDRRRLVARRADDARLRPQASPRRSDRGQRDARRARRGLPSRDPFVRARHGRTDHDRGQTPDMDPWDMSRKAVAYSTVTVLARLRGWSTFRPRRRAMR